MKGGKIYATIFHDKTTDVVLDLVMISDITEQKQVFENLIQSEEKYRNLFEHANDMIQSVDAEGCFVDVNPKWLTVLGYAREEVRNLHLKDILRVDQIPHCMDLFQQVLQGKSVEMVSTVFISKTGKEIMVEGSANGLFKNGVFVATIGIFREITESG